MIYYFHIYGALIAIVCNVELNYVVKYQIWFNWKTIIVGLGEVERHIHQATKIEYLLIITYKK